MRKSALLTVLFLFMSIYLNCFAGETVQLTNGEWPPFLSKELKNYGVASHIVTEAFALEGIKVEYKFYPWKRGLNRAEKGLADGSIIWAPTPKREKVFYFSDPVISNEKVFFYMKSHPFDWDTIDDLKGIKIGVTRGYTYGEQFDEARKEGKIEVDEVTEDRLNVLKLLKRRIDVFLVETDIVEKNRKK